MTKEMRKERLRNGIGIIAIILFTTVLIEETYGQCKKITVEYEDGKEIVKQSKEIVWYGMDFGMATLTNGSKMNDGELIRDKYCPAWLAYVNKDVPHEKVEKYYEHRTKIIYEPALEWERYKILDAENWVVGYEKHISIDEMKEAVKKYKLPQKSGIGSVLIIDNLNKPKERVTAYLVYFDIKNREIYWIIKTEAKPGSKFGMTKYWGNALISNLKCALKMINK